MKTRDIKPFGLRLQPAVKDAARGEATMNRRSLNAEIELLIEEALKCREQRRASMA
ncbi:Arc family DNA-binding protein [Pseudomonas sp. TUM22785]|uniref:Arc family DNA-binding protein n=1 Tax=Pseudomonas sp. TUM22785 TaxID=3019098 RepID=UPI0023052BC5|nr:Arc family DNA-binding protein [Pseudomonas sp. TUM22785]WCD79147.1 Arc family DNA-binding protein [Pseudomonas sp. TUM22785]